MPIRLSTVESLSFLDYATGRAEDMEKAATAAIRAATMGFRDDLRRALMDAGVKSVVGNMIGATVYPKVGHSLNAAGSVYGRGERAQFILWALSQAAVIRPGGGGKYLVVPTSYNRVGGRRGAAMRITPQQMAAMKGWTFTRPIRGGVSQYSGGKVWFLRVAVAEQRKETVRTTKSSKERRYVSTKTLAFAGGVAGLLVGGGRASRTELITGARPSQFPAGAVPMFLLLAVVQRGQKHDPDAIAQKWADAIPGLIDAAYPG